MNWRLLALAAASSVPTFSSGVSTMNGVFLSRFSTLKPILRVLLSSIVELFLGGQSLATKKLVYIPTASNVLSQISEKPKGEQRRRQRYEAKQKLKLLVSELGMEQGTVLEIEDPKLSTLDIQQCLSRADIVYVDGGNTFFLQYHILKSGFWDAVDPLLKSNKLLYMGASAGAIVAGQSIETAFWKGWDNPNPVGLENHRWDHDNLRGRGLYEKSLFMHFDKDTHSALVEEKQKTLGIEGVHCLRDDACLLIPNNLELHSG
jgi:peptidase E